MKNKEVFHAQTSGIELYFHLPGIEYLFYFFIFILFHLDINCLVLCYCNRNATTQYTKKYVGLQTGGQGGIR